MLTRHHIIQPSRQWACKRGKGVLRQRIGTNVHIDSQHGRHGGVHHWRHMGSAGFGNPRWVKAVVREHGRWIVEAWVADHVGTEERCEDLAQSIRCLARLKGAVTNAAVSWARKVACVDVTNRASAVDTEGVAAVQAIRCRVLVVASHKRVGAGTIKTPHLMGIQLVHEAPCILMYRVTSHRCTRICNNRVIWLLGLGSSTRFLARLPCQLLHRGLEVGHVCLDHFGSKNVDHSNMRWLRGRVPVSSRWSRRSPTIGRFPNAMRVLVQAHRRLSGRAVVIIDSRAVCHHFQSVKPLEENNLSLCDQWNDQSQENLLCWILIMPSGGLFGKWTDIVTSSLEGRLTSLAIELAVLALQQLWGYGIRAWIVPFWTRTCAWDLYQGDFT